MKKSNLLQLTLSLFLLAGIISLLSCSSEPAKTEAEKNAEKLEESMENLKENLEDVGENLQKSGENVADNLEDALKNVGESLNGMKLTKDGKEVETISFREIKKVMPAKIQGLKQKETSGETNGAFGVKISTAEGKYGEGDERFELNITDTGGAGMVMMATAAWSKVEIDRENDREIEYTTTVDGYKAFVKFNKKNQRGEYNVIVDERFIVQLKSWGMSIDKLEEAVEDLGLKGMFRKLG